MAFIMLEADGNDEGCREGRDRATRDLLKAERIAAKGMATCIT
jgi:hypothetical protein